MSNYFAGWTTAEMINNADLDAYAARDEALARNEKAAKQRAALMKKLAKIDAEMAMIDRVYSEALREITKQAA